jgi:hypothetical protein
MAPANNHREDQSFPATGGADSGVECTVNGGIYLLWLRAYESSVSKYESDMYGRTLEVWWLLWRGRSASKDGRCG